MSNRACKASGEAKNLPSSPHPQTADQGSLPALHISQIRAVSTATDAERDINAQDLKQLT